MLRCQENNIFFMESMNGNKKLRLKGIMFIYEFFQSCRIKKTGEFSELEDKTDTTKVVIFCPEMK